MSALLRWIRRIGWSATTLLLIGAIFMAIGIADLQKILDAQSWPTTAGRIVRSEILGAVAPNDEPYYYLSVEYRYRYQGIDYTGKRISFGDTFDVATRKDAVHAWGTRLVELVTLGGSPVYGDGSRGVVEYHARAFQAGQEVTVYVDPLQPNRAVIDVQPSWYNTRYLDRALLMFAIALILVVFRLLRDRKNSGAEMSG